TPRLLATLQALDSGHGEAGAALGLLRGRTPPAWHPLCGAVDGIAEAVLGGAAERLGRPVLNPDQERAWRAVLARPVSVVGGPPGTGKTYLLAWALIGVAAAARREGRPCRILVTAATHRAIVNVLARLAGELRGSGTELPLRIAKLRGSGSEADAELDGAGVELLPDTPLASLLARAGEAGEPLVVGSTVWSIWKQMRAAPEGEGEEDGGGEVPVRPWFDLIVVDEASQMKVAEALIALSAMRAEATVVLCGDDRQLAPVLRGRYEAD